MLSVEHGRDFKLGNARIILALYFNVTDKFTDKFTDKNRDSVQVRSKFGLSLVQRVALFFLFEKIN